MLRAVVVLALLGASACKDEKPDVRAKELEVELARARAAQARAEADKAVAEAMPTQPQLPNSVSPDDPGHQMQSDAAARHAAEAAAQEAAKRAFEAKTQLDAVMRDLEMLDTKVTDAVTAVTEAQTDADRTAAGARLMQLKQEHQELLQRAAAARAAAERAERTKAVKISKECLDNPLAKGCS
jgi:hypothetical protein